MINVIQAGDIYTISFRYNADVIHMVKQVPGRRWVPENKYWTIPVDKLGFFLNQIKGTVFENQVLVVSDEQLNINATLDATSDIPDVDISNVTFRIKPGSKPYQHQLDCIKFAIDRYTRGYKSGFILADEQGLGKTASVFNLALYNRDHRGYKHCLIICCINSSKFNWYNDIIEHTDGAEIPYILGSRLKRDGSIRYGGSKEKFEDLKTGKMYGGKTDEELPYFLITNIESIRYKVGKSYEISDMIIRWIDTDMLQMIAIDEIHKNASPRSLQGKQLHRIKNNIHRTVEWIPMTGTPITNTPTDVYLPLKLVGGHQYKSFYTWCNNFCVYGGYGGYEIIGYKNIPKLKELLQGNMLRRLKSDVLDLPPKIYFTEYVENTTYQNKLYKEVRGDIISNRSKILESLNPLSQLLRLRQVNGSPEILDSDLSLDDTYFKYNAKIVRLFELLEDIHDRGEKVVVFSNWVEPLRTLYKFVSKKYGTCCFTGTMSIESREKHKRVFQTNPKYTVLLGTIGAAGTSHTFTAASNIIFYDEPWTPSDKEQAEDRCHRIGTKSSVNVYTLITKDTVDERVHDIIYTKKGISQYIVDNLDIRKNPKLFDLLLKESL